MITSHWGLLFVLILIVIPSSQAAAGKKIGHRRPKSRNQDALGGGGDGGGGSDDGGSMSFGGGMGIGNDYNASGQLQKSRPLSPEEKLLRDLFQFYSADARAGLDSKQTVTVNVHYTLLRIQGMDERTQVLTTTGLVITEWMDERLVWNPELYHNITDIVIPPTMIWLPELALMNGAENMVHDFDRMGVSVTYTGNVHWEPGGIFSTTCDMDITYFPFDKQQCPIIVGAWAYYSQRMNITNSTDKLVMHDYTVNGEWEVLDTSVQWGEDILPCCPDIRYPYVTSTLFMKRRIMYYFVNIMIPCFMLSVLVLVSFCIPPEAGEKISCGISVLLAFTVFLLMVSETVPKTSLQMPIIAIYLTSTMLLGAISLALSMMVLNVHHSNKGRDVPRWIQVTILTLMAGVLCMKTGTRWHSKRFPKRQPSNSLTPANQDDGDTGSTSGQERTANPHLGVNMDNNSPSREHRPINDQVYTASDIDPGDREQDALYHETVVRVKKSRKKKPKPCIEHEPEWRDVSRVMDRLFFCLVLMAMLVSSALTLCAPYYANS